MARWRKGEEQIARLIEQRYLQQVAADTETAAALLASAARHVESATALLAHQGLRPTTTGGHIAVVDAVRAQFPGVPGLTSLDRLRRRRNQAEYPNPTSYDPITADEAKEAIEVAAGCVSSTDRLLQLDELGIF
jgi:hypothetical protein